MTSKPLTAACCLLALGLALPACRNTTVKVFDHTVAGGSGAQDRRPLRYAGGLPLKSFDPNGAAGWCEATALLHARLYTVDGDGRVVPDLVASSTVADDGRRWRLELREGLRFHDGEPLDADDVVATFRRLSALPGSEVAGNLAAISAVERRGPRTVELVLDAPRPELPAMLTELAILPAHRLEEEAAAFEADPVGAGPYRLLGREPGVLFFGAHAAYHLGAPRTEWLTLVLIEDDRARARALSDGVVDVACVKPQDLDLLGDAARFRRHRCATGVIRAIPLDVRAPGLDDPAVRRALGALVPRERLVAEALGGLGRPAWQLLAPDNVAFDPGADAAWASTEEALAALDRAGWPRGADGLRRDGAGRVLTVRLVAWQGEAFRRLAAPLIAEAWRDAGIDASVLPVDHAGYVALARDLHGRAEGYVGGWSTLFAPVSVLEKKLAASGSQNRLGFGDAALDAMLERAAAEESLGRRVAAVRSAQRRGLELAPWIPLVYADHLFVSAAGITGFEPRVVDSWYEIPRLLWRAEVAVGAPGARGD